MSHIFVSAKRISLMINMIQNKIREENIDMLIEHWRKIFINICFFSSTAAYRFLDQRNDLQTHLMCIDIDNHQFYFELWSKWCYTWSGNNLGILGNDVSKWNFVDCFGSIQSTVIKSSYIKTSTCYLCGFKCD